MNKLRYMAGVAIAAMAISSCDEDTLSIGNSITENSDRLEVSNVTYYATTRTIVADSVLALTTNCYLGRIIDPETVSNAEVKSEFSTQFQVLENLYVSPEDMIASRTEDGERAAADSCDFILYLTSPFSTLDTLAAMKMQVQELSVPVETGKTYYTNYDLAKEGMIRTDGIKRNKMFTYRNLNDTESYRSESDYIDNIRITLNEPYTDKAGQQYSNYGSYILRQYYDHPEYFRNSYTLSHYVCPGFFFSITDGLGFYAKVANIGLRVFYRVHLKDSEGNDSIAPAAIIMAGTKEVKQTNLITNDMEAINQLASEDGYTYLKTPAGLFTEVTLPVDDIKQNHASDSLLGAKIVFQRLNSNSTNERMFGIPQTLLMVQKDSLNSFFEKLKLPDSQLSYLSGFTSATNTYTFSNISKLVTALWNAKEAGLKTNANWTAENPNWNKVLLIPISYTTASSNSTTPTRVEHDMSLTSTRLVGGTSQKIAVKAVYAKFK